MSYTKQTWSNGENGGTPISAARLTHVEDGLEDTASDVDDHLADSSDAHNASAISFSPTGGVGSTDVQAAIAEVAGDMSAHLADTVDAHDASAISVIPVGTISSTTVQAAFAELDSDVSSGITTVTNHVATATGAHAATAIVVTPTGTISSITAQAALVELDGDITAHLADTVDAHDASAISVVPTGNIASITVQAALAELDTNITSGASAAAHIADTSDAHHASAIGFTPAGTIAATDAQAAIVELDGDITTHLADAADAHDASAISVTPVGTIAATDVQAAISELQGDLTTHESASGAHVATNITFSPTGTISSTTVQAAIAEISGDTTTDVAALAAHLADTSDAHDASSISITAISTISATDVQGALAELQSDIVNGSIQSAMWIPLYDLETAALTIGSKWYGSLPYGMTLSAVKLAARSSSSFGAVTIDIKANTFSLFNTLLTLDEGELTSTTAAVPYSLGTLDVAKDAEVEILVNTAGIGVTGLKLWLVGTRKDSATSPAIPIDYFLVDENFDAGTAGDPIDTVTSTATSVVGTGVVKFASDWIVEGSGSMHIQGIDSNYLSWTNITHTVHYGKWYYKHGANGSQTAWFLYVYNQAATPVLAYRVGVDSTGHVIIQNGTAGSTSTSSFTLTPGSRYRMDNTAAVSGVCKVTVYNDANIASIIEAEGLGSVSITTTQTTFANEQLGLINSISGGGTLVSPNLTSELFNGTNLAVPTNANTSSGVPVGSGALTFSTSSPMEGTASMRVNGLTTHYLPFTIASHNSHYVSIYFKYITAPGSNMYFYQVRNGSNAAYAFQVGIGTTGILRIRDQNNGTGTKLATGLSALVSGTVYRLDITAVGGGTLQLRYYNGANLNSAVTGNATETLTMTDTLTQTNFSNEHLGNLATVTGTTPDLFVDRLYSSDTALPSPIGATGSSNFDAYIDRYKSSNIVMPDNYIFSTSGIVGADLAPSNGCWWGAHTPTFNSHTGSQVGLDSWVTLSGRRPDTFHIYKSGTWDGIITSTERSLLEPSGLPRAIPLINWKCRNNLTPAQIVAGGNDANIIKVAQNLPFYPYKILLILDHEFDTTSWTAADAQLWADMFRYVVALMKANGAGNVKFCICPVGYSGNVGSNGATYNAMYPGDDVVDWIMWDPYFQTTARLDFGTGLSGGGSPRSLINENVAGATGWTGMYAWATIPKTVGVNGLRYSFGGNKPLGIAEWGVWYTTMVTPAPPSGAVSPDPSADLLDATGATRITSIGSQIQDFPRIKLISYYNDVIAHFNKLDVTNPSKTASLAAIVAVGALAYFNVGTNNAT